MNIMAAIIISTVLMSGYGQDFGAPLFYTSTGIPVVVHSDNIPLIEDVQATETLHLRLVQEMFGKDARDDYVRAARDYHVTIVFQNVGDSTGLSKVHGKYPAGQYDGRVLRITYDSGCMAAWALPHELIHLMHFTLMGGYVDYAHNDNLIWDGPDSFQAKARSAPEVLRFCTEEFYDVYGIVDWHLGG